MGISMHLHAMTSRIGRPEPRVPVFRPRRHLLHLHLRQDTERPLPDQVSPYAICATASRSILVSGNVSVQLHRLDFDNLVTASPPTTGENLGKLANDLFIKNSYSSIFFPRFLRRRQRLGDRGEPERLEPARRLRPALGAAQ